MTAVRRLMQEYRDLTLDPPEGVVAGPRSENDYFTWDVQLAGPEDTPWQGGLFEATLTFPRDYPLSPPKMVFRSRLFHPNVYPTGEVCISILHPPGDDPLQYEQASERWSPVQSVEKILLSVTSMLAEPNCDSPANVDAAKMFRDHPEEFARRAEQCVEQSLFGDTESSSSNGAGQNRQGKTRLSKWYTGGVDEQERRRLADEMHRLVTSRNEDFTNFVEFREYKVVYKRYAGLFFAAAVDPEDNELAILEGVHLFVEVLDAYFGNVTELDLVFNFHKCYTILDEVFLAGEIVETSKPVVLARMEQMDMLP